jgi:hypothetical protein
MIYHHANENGTLELDENYKQPSKNEQIQIIKDAFKTNNHVITTENEGEQPIKAKINLSSGEEKVYIYYKPVNGGGSGRSNYEHRIQIPVSHNNALCDHIDNEEKALLFGIYKRNGISVLVSWRCDRSTASTIVSKQVGIQSIANAMRDGFSQYVYKGAHGSRIACVFRIEFLYFYIENIEKLHQSLIKSMEVIDEENEKFEENQHEIDLPGKPHNRILFGAPGTGKSYILEQNKEVFGDNYERVTFHPNYSYAQFVGSYKPKPKLKVDGSEYVSYEFVPGPFLRLWIDAVKSKKANGGKNYLLVIEEINRANVAAVFGDIFQLLDRKADGESEYSINTTEDMKDYLMNECKFEEYEVREIKIPSNLYIWATMNSADQGVFPMDTAFKRRWNFEYIDINQGSGEITGKFINLKPYGNIEWNTLRNKINDRLTQADLNINEDKLIGPFFISNKELASDNIDEIFKSKLLMYLFEDVLKHRKGKLFAPKYNTFSKVLAAYDNSENVFDFEVNSSIGSYLTDGDEGEDAMPSMVAENSGMN